MISCQLHVILATEFSGENNMQTLAGKKILLGISGGIDRNKTKLVLSLFSAKDIEN